jgi:peptidoglycan/LPS O-acetylase OafA/YrhL
MNVTSLIENEYAQEQLADGVRNLRGAYERAAGRRAAKAADDKKLYKRLRRGAGSMVEGVAALRSDRRRPERSWPKVLALAGGGAAAAAAVVMARTSGDQPAPAQAA